MKYALEDFKERFEVELVTVPLLTVKGADVEEATETLYPLLVHNIMMHKRPHPMMEQVETPESPTATVIDTFGPFPYNDPRTRMVASDREVHVLLIEVKTPWKLDVEDALHSWGMSPAPIGMDEEEDD